MLISQSSSVNEAIGLHAPATPSAALPWRSRPTLISFVHALLGNGGGGSLGAPRVALYAKNQSQRQEDFLCSAVSSSSGAVPSSVPLTMRSRKPKPPERV